MTSYILWRLIGSKPVVISSNNKIGGYPTSESINVTLLRIPPLNARHGILRYGNKFISYNLNFTNSYNDYLGLTFGYNKAFSSLFTVSTSSPINYSSFF